jgi:hypothetical protein
MKFGYFCNITNWNHKPYAKLLDEVRELAIHMNADADLQDQARNFRLFDESLTIMKKAWTQELFSHQGEFYTYPAPDFNWQHDMSPPNPELVDLETSQLKSASA